MRIALASHAWTPQANGVVTILKATAATLASLGHEIEALAWGVPVAAFPVPGPRDVIEPGVTGVLPADLTVAIGAALRLDRRPCAARARAWHAASQQVLDGLVPIPLTQRAGVAVRRSSAMIERIAARRQPSQAGDAN